jgi:hypothetical protein
MQQKFNVGIVTFSYGGNGGISSEVPDIREWMTPLVVDLSKDPRVDAIRIWNLADTPITMTRNRAVLQAREFGVDVLVMVDSDMKPDLYAGLPDAKPFFQSSFDFLVEHYHKGPCVIGAPYCGPPPVECVYVFRWNNQQNENPSPDFQLEMYDRHTAVKMAGVQECAALPTGLIMYDMRAFDLTEPKKPEDKPWFYYEWKDHFCAEKASTEDVTQTRDLSLVGAQKLGYNPVYCNWDAWAGHWKPKCVGKPQVIAASGVSHKLKDCWEANVEPGVKLVDFRSSVLDKLPKPSEFDDLGMALSGQDARALGAMIRDFRRNYGFAPSVCEVGSWAGRSAIIMARSGATVTCVDTWEGSVNDNGCHAYDGSRGSPLDVFRRNTAGLPITAHVGRSPDAARDFDDHSFDIVYIDAEHDYESVKADIAAWKPKARHVLAGHDYHSFPEVQRAVRDSDLIHTVDANVWQTRVDLTKPAYVVNH